MNNQKFIICKFFKSNSGKYQGQLQSYVGNDKQGTLFLVDRHMSAIPEGDVREGVFYYCGVNNIIGQRDDYHFLATVSVIECLGELEGGAFWDQETTRGKQWQYRTSRRTFDLTIIVDRNCENKPKNVGQFWSFDVVSVVSVVKGLVILAANLKEAFASEHAYKKTISRRQAKIETSKKTSSVAA